MISSHRHPTHRFHNDLASNIVPFSYHVAHGLVFASRKHVNLAVITVAKLAPRDCGFAISASKLLNFQDIPGVFLL
jgi:hypothetical protein